MSYRVRSVWVSTLLLAGIISCMISAHPLPGTAGNPSSAGAGGPSGPALTKEDLIWVTDVYADMQHRIRDDSIPPVRILEDLKQLWHGRFTDRLADSIPGLSSPLGRLASMQVDHISTLLDTPETSVLTSGSAGTGRLNEAALAIRHLSHLLPLVQATRDSLRGSLLVVSSVGCECELERCAKMAGLYDSIQADSLRGPMAMVDLMQVPPLEDLLGPIDIPYWILFTEDGRPATLLGGDSDPEDIRPTIASWLDVPHSPQNSRHPIIRRP